MEQEEILKRLDAIGNRLGVATEQIWSVLVRQALVESIAKTCFFGGWILVAIFWTRHNLKLLNLKTPITDYFVFCCAANGVLVVGTLIGLLFETMNVISGYINPEFWALQYVKLAFK